MPDPLTIHGLQPGQPMAPLNRPAQTGPTSTPDGKSFRDLLIDRLEQVNRLQLEAADGVEKVVAGQENSLAEVFSAVRKADIAFSMLMEMRNKLIDACRELQQMQNL